MQQTPSYLNYSSLQRRKKETIFFQACGIFNKILRPKVEQEMQGREMEMLEIN